MNPHQTKKKKKNERKKARATWVRKEKAKGREGGGREKGKETSEVIIQGIHMR